MKPTHVTGKKKGDILIYALSTCGWCRKTKKFFDERGLAYSFVDVDLLSDEENLKAMEEVKKWNPSGSFPTIVVNHSRGIRGYQPQELKEIAGE